MAFNYTGDATLGVSLSVEVPKPLDVRSVVKNLTELYSIPEKYAYQGMTVANIEDGNMYMLIDKAHIADKIGWKASYESIQIITCTEQEYQEWKKNTTPEYTPINPELTFLHANTYYYIYEDSLDDNQFYLSAEWGKQIEKTLGRKANADTVNAIATKVDADIKNLAENYTNSIDLYAKFIQKTELDIGNPSSTISTILNRYYPKEETDKLFLTKTSAEDIYVTKESLRGDSPSTGTDDFIFVTQAKYQQDKEALAQEITSKIVNGEQIKTQKITVGTDQVITSKESRLNINDNQVAYLEEVPKIQVMPQTEYDALPNPDPDTYYYTYGDKSLIDTGYVTSEFLHEKFYTKKQIDGMMPGEGAGNMSVEGETLILG